jgi:hypothetical protein
MRVLFTHPALTREKLSPAFVHHTCEPFIAQLFVKIALGFSENEIEIDWKSFALFQTISEIDTSPSLQSVANDGRADLARQRPSATQTPAWILDEIHQKPRTRAKTLSIL